MKPKERSAADMLRAMATIVLGLVVLGLFVVALGGFRFWERLTQYTILFDTVKDLNVGQPVKLDGMNIGRVVTISPYAPDPSQVQVTIGVRDNMPLYANCVASISQRGLVGDYYVLLTLQGQTGPVLPPESVIISKQTPGLAEIGALVGDLVATLKPRLERIATGLEQLFTPENIHQISTVLADLEILVNSAQATVRTLQTELDGVGAQAKDTLAHGTATLDQARDTFVMVQTDFTALSTELRAQVHEVGTRYADLASQVQTDLGYNQEQLTQVLDQVQRLSEELTVLTQDVKERPWQLLRAPRAFPEVRQ
ncbi:MlaD family protein [Megalodesulfovibrio gigas]|uniref:Putative mammalian cell entry domain-containing protein n=1 Tax=Megalodesulfovibrio gigas (strain ATCC 19364 / DSM 1382 / NCIMB 9332 / VKM B-1759) TaxID=1121448 RepID=T2G999_MEGG1|nr:MlaD family protein [Megalodesulfovibrio gigas]AGW12749.1 putative mammalian cell entry domain-containing protein [Megalodesulfovibrio gigas DSM 1382 = ATCC 19364]